MITNKQILTEVEQLSRLFKDGEADIPSMWNCFWPCLAAMFCYYYGLSPCLVISYFCRITKCSSDGDSSFCIGGFCSWVVYDVVYSKFQSIVPLHS